jgi:glycosyltransferase involved in cell wall biosynthesis
MFARYHPIKDHFTALLAARGVQESGLRTNFFFAGAGVDHHNTSLCRLIKRLGLESSAHLLGYRKDVASLMAAMDTVISCSHSEGLSNVIGEAMAAGVPCVVTDVGDSALVVGDTGKTVRPQDPEALAKALLEILRMPADKRKALGGKARARIQHHYTIEKVADTYSQLYQKTTIKK